MDAPINWKMVFADRCLATLNPPTPQQQIGRDSLLFTPKGGDGSRSRTKNPKTG